MIILIIMLMTPTIVIIMIIMISGGSPTFGSGGCGICCVAAAGLRGAQFITLAGSLG